MINFNIKILDYSYNYIYWILIFLTISRIFIYNNSSRSELITVPRFAELVIDDLRSKSSSKSSVIYGTIDDSRDNHQKKRFHRFFSRYASLRESSINILRIFLNKNIYYHIFLLIIGYFIISLGFIL